MQNQQLGFPAILSAYEVVRRQPFLPEAHLIARLHILDPDLLFNSPRQNFSLPFDRRLGEMLIRTISTLFGRHSLLRYAYLEREEFSLLFHPSDTPVSASSLNNRLTAEASAKLSLELGEVHILRGSLYQFISVDQVVHYFRWRQDDFMNKALDSYCYWILVRNGADAQGAAKILEGLGEDEKVEILDQNDVDYREVPTWQRFGTSLVRNEGSRISVETALPTRRAYELYLRDLL